MHLLTVVRTTQLCRQFVISRFLSYSIKPSFIAAEKFGSNVAIDDVYGQHTYSSLLARSRHLSEEIDKILNSRLSKSQQRIAVLCPNDVQYIVSMWAVWMSGHIFVPLSKSSPPSHLNYFIEDSESSLVISSQNLADKVEPITRGRELLILDEIYQKPNFKEESTNDRVFDQSFYLSKKNSAMILYTSGTTGNPKGVVISYRNLQSHIENLLVSWEWSANDYILHSLPLHHVHGIVNALLCPLACGARCLLLPKFKSQTVWNELIASKPDKINIMMGVPTMYKLLIDYYDEIYSKSIRMKDLIMSICTQTIRLMVSGSAPLPDPIFDRWEEITGHQLLERYGMTEIGMALSMPLIGARQPGYVGVPLPNVHVRIARKSQHNIYTTLVEGNQYSSHCLNPSETAGELLVKGPNVFNNYYQKKVETENAFTADGWFITGDTAIYSNGWYKIMGRTSVDIIKSGGYKISALDVEKNLLLHPNISDVAVVGLPDPTWGEKIVAVIVLKDNGEVTIQDVKNWGKEHLPPYCLPSEIKIVTKLTRNHMGKLNKKELREQLIKQEVK